MFNYQIINPPNFQFNEKVISKFFELISIHIKKTQNGILNIVFISEDEIKELNKKYRNKDYVTDVLSFHYFDNYKELSNNEIAGELIFCEEKIVKQGKEYGLGEEKEFYKLLIHSILHILGYDHEIDEDYVIMKELEEKIWFEVFDN